MPPITPLGKPLSQQPLSQSSFPHEAASSADKPISAFELVSLIRATWTWLIKPLWYLCVKWPVMAVLPPRLSQREIEEREKKRREWEDFRRRREMSSRAAKNL